LKIEDKLGKNVFKVDKAGHIQINQEICRTECMSKYCLFVCPAKVYSLDSGGDIHPKPDGCLECGACVLACLEKALSWHYPKSGFGVQYRFS
jgi:ferredoxin like protein